MSLQTQLNSFVLRVAEEFNTVKGRTGTLTAPFGTVGTLPARWIVNYDAEEKTAYLVYNFGTLFSLR